jgi:hypothetical protein
MQGTSKNERVRSTPCRELAWLREREATRERRAAERQVWMAKRIEHARARLALLSSAALGHHLATIPRAQPVGQMAPNAQHDDGSINVAPLDQRPGLRRELGHVRQDRPSLRFAPDPHFLGSSQK